MWLTLGNSVMIAKNDNTLRNYQSLCFAQKVQVNITDFDLSPIIFTGVVVSL